MSPELSGQNSGWRACLPNRLRGVFGPCVVSEACVMSEKPMMNESQPVSFGERLANSQAFADLFRDGIVAQFVISPEDPS